MKLTYCRLYFQAFEIIKDKILVTECIAPLPVPKQNLTKHVSQTPNLKLINTAKPAPTSTLKVEIRSRQCSSRHQSLSYHFLMAYQLEAEIIPSGWWAASANFSNTSMLFCHSIPFTLHRVYNTVTGAWEVVDTNMPPWNSSPQQPLICGLCLTSNIQDKWICFLGWLQWYIVLPALSIASYSMLCLVNWLAELLRISVIEEATEHHSHQWFMKSIFIW